MRALVWLVVLVGVVFVGAGRGRAADGARLPEGAGLSARCPGDVGLDGDDAVIFVERFDEPSIDAVAGRWDTVVRPDTMALVDDAAPGAADRRSVRITHVGGDGDGGQFYRRLEPGFEQVYARFYVKFDPGCHPIHHFGTHLGGFHPMTRWPQGGAGERPDGAKRFTSGVEPNGDDWRWDFYTYWQGMRVHGDGRYWGTPHLAGAERPPVERGRWICVELMIRVNDVGQSNGEQAFWIDGRLQRQDGQVTSHVGPGFPRGRWTGGWWSPDAAADTAFEGYAWRTIPELAVNYLWTYVYITTAPRGHVSRVSFDNIVVAREYVGPIVPRP